MKIHTILFSATGGTRKVVEAIAKGIQESCNGEICCHDFTLPKGRESIPYTTSADIAVVGTPVYAGRVPNLLLKYLQTLQGDGCMAIPIVTYGNRNFDDALLELHDILKEYNFSPVAAAAFVSQHSFSTTLAAGRPNEADLEKAYGLGREIAAKYISGPYGMLLHNTSGEDLQIPGRNSQERKYYQPKDSCGNPIDIRKVKPKTSENCNACGHCAAICPMGAIDAANPKSVQGICIKCNACIKECSQNAKYFDDPGYLYHKEDLELKYGEKNEAPKIFL